MAAFLALAGTAAVPFMPAFGDTQPASPSAAVWNSSFKDLTDTPQPLSRWKGKVAVVYFWATWCIPCRLETPKLVKLYNEFRDRDMVVIGIALDNGDKVRAFAKANNVDYPVVYGGRSAVQLGRDLGNTEGAIPFTVVIDKQGKIVETIKGDTPPGKLEAVLKPLLG